MKRLKSKHDLLEFSVERYHHYHRTLMNENSRHARASLKDMLTDLLVIQEYARKHPNGNGEGR